MRIRVFRKMLSTVLAASLIGATGLQPVQATINSDTVLTNPTVNYRTNPIGIETMAPEFS